MADPAGNAEPLIEAVTFLARAEMERSLVEEIVAGASRSLAVPCRLHTAPWDDAATRINGREQVDADALLSALEHSTSRGEIRIGLTAHDLGLVLFTFVFGRARRHGHSAIVSLARLSPEHYGLPTDIALTARRAVAEVLHELGHVAGLAHCSNLGCIMYFATNVETVDLRGTVFCDECRAALPRQLLSGSAFSIQGRTQESKS